MNRRRLFSLLSGPALFLILWLMPAPAGMPPAAQAVLASCTWIVVWWVSEAVPIPVTSVLPLVLFPLTGGLDMQATASGYADPMIYFYLGGFMLALALERWNLHKRIALNIVYYIGVRPDTLVLGFMVATAFLSMWLSNSATAMMMTPIGLAVIGHFNREQGASLARPLLLGIAYAASIGGMATLVGTSTNMVFARYVSQQYKQELSFANWMALALPISVLLLLGCWWLLTRVAFRIKLPELDGGRALIRREIEALGPLNYEEKVVLTVFSLVSLAWIGRQYLINPFFPKVNDSIIALTGATLLFILPSRADQGRAILSWEHTATIPWGMLLLLGGGFAFAQGFEESGLSAWTGQWFLALKGVPLPIVLLVLSGVSVLLTEIASNTATANMLMPILAALALSLGVHPYGLMGVAVLAASAGFMLPAGTPPNAIAFGTGYISIRQMARAGLLVDLLAALLIPLAVYLLMNLIWGIRIDRAPDF